MRRAVAVIVLIAMALAGLVAARFTSEATSASLTINTADGVIELTGGTATVARTIEGMGSGDWVDFTVALHNASTFRFSSVGLSVTDEAAVPSAMTTDADNGLQLIVDACPVAWDVTDPANPTCADPYTVIGPSPVVGGNGERVRFDVGPHDPNETTYLRLRVMLSQSADSTLMGKGAELVFEFSADRPSPPDAAGYRLVNRTRVPTGWTAMPFATPDGSVWAMTQAPGGSPALVRTDPDGDMHTYALGGMGIPSEAAWGFLTSTSDGATWGVLSKYDTSYTYYLVRVDPATGSKSVKTVTNAGLTSSPLGLGSDGTKLWMVTYTGELARIATDGTVEAVFDVSSGFPGMIPAPEFVVPNGTSVWLAGTDASSVVKLVPVNATTGAVGSATDVTSALTVTGGTVTGYPDDELIMPLGGRVYGSSLIGFQGMRAVGFDAPYFGGLCWVFDPSGPSVSSTPCATALGSIPALTRALGPPESWSFSSGAYLWRLYPVEITGGSHRYIDFSRKNA